MNVGLPFLEQIRKAGHRLSDRVAPRPNENQTGAEGGLLAQGIEQTGWGWSALTFQQIVAAVTTGYHREHNTNDTHATIHATGAIYERSRTVALGDWINVPFDATNFAGASAMLWTVTQASQIAYSYWRVGTTAFFTYWFDTTLLGGTASTSLKVTLPPGLTIGAYASAPVHYVNGAVSGVGYARAIPGDRFLALYKEDDSAWSTAGIVTVHGQIAVQISDGSGDLSVSVLDPILTYTGAVNGANNFATTTTFGLTTAGTYSITVNRPMTLTLFGVAGGGGGGTSSAGGAGAGSSGGGGGGSLNVGLTLALLPAKTYQAIVGAAGAAAFSATAGGGTSFSNVTDATTLMSLGGGGGGRDGQIGGVGAGGTAITGAGAEVGGAGGAGGNTGNAFAGSASTGNGCGGGGGGGGGGPTTTGGAGGAGGASGGTGGTGAGTNGGNNGGLAGGGGEGVAVGVPGPGGGGGGGGGCTIAAITGAYGGGGGGGAWGTTSGHGTGGAGQPGIVAFAFISAP